MSAVPVKRFLRNKIIGDKNSPQIYYLSRVPGHFRTETIESIARQIEATGALSVEDVIHTMKAFVRELRKALVKGDKVKVDGLGTFFISFKTQGSPVEKECTVRNISKVNIRFSADSTLRLVNDSTASTRGGENNVRFYIKGEEGATSPGDGEDNGGSDGGNDSGGNENPGGGSDPGDGGGNPDA